MTLQLAPSFVQLVAEIKKFRLTCAPFNEAEIELGLERFLQSRHYPVHRQVTNKKGRFDLKVGKLVIEVKDVGHIDIAEQLDRYSAVCSGLVVVCWKATKNLKRLFASVKAQTDFPIELIEVYKNSELV